MGCVSEYLRTRLLDAVFGGGSGQSAWTGAATLYIGLSTQAWSSSVTDAALLAGEPSSTGGYARIAVTNNRTNFPSSAAGAPASMHLHVAQSFPESTAAWSTGSTPLRSLFVADAATLGGGHVLWSMALDPDTDIVNVDGITLTLDADAVEFTLG